MLDARTATWMPTYSQLEYQSMAEMWIVSQITKQRVMRRWSVAPFYYLLASDVRETYNSYSQILPYKHGCLAFDVKERNREKSKSI